MGMGKLQGYNEIAWIKIYAQKEETQKAEMIMAVKWNHVLSEDPTEIAKMLEALGFKETYPDTYHSFELEIEILGGMWTPLESKDWIINHNKATWQTATPIRTIKEILQGKGYTLKEWAEKQGEYYCVSSNALVYGKPCDKWCGSPHCKELLTKEEQK